MSLFGQESVPVIQSQFPLPTGRGSAKPGGMSHVKVPISGKLNLGNERMNSEVSKLSIIYNYYIFVKLNCMLDLKISQRPQRGGEESGFG